ncbi:MAG: SET domain-containing protein-lysine N-methyltransferase [Planctomycetaceae bacterium]|jgi:hypothetical protein|nr:SET domain-containing protein-lysine N-methyltransferase [Planctomycetaceae bacterium]
MVIEEESEKLNQGSPVRQSSDYGRVFSSGVRIGKTSYGLGVFAFAFMPQGTPIARVAGHIVSDPNYGSDYCIGAGEGKVLEPAPPFCYLNHSCEPNCQLVQYVREENTNESEELESGVLASSELDFDSTAEPIEYEDECYYGGGEYEDDNRTDEVTDDENDEEEMPFADDADAEIWVETLRDILPDEELSIDYAWSADRAAKCLCGKPTCRGWIVDPKELHFLKNQ